MSIAKNKLVLAVLFITIIVSGCAGGDGEETSDTAAIDVNELSAFPNPAPGDQNVRFRMQLENVGDHDAEDVYARLYNPPFADSSADTNSWRSESGDGVDTAERTLEFSDLDAPGDTPATPSTRTVTFQSPEVDDGRTVDYTMRADILYRYGTSATTELEVMGDDAYRDAGSPQGSASIQNDVGPIQMEIRTPTPIAIYDTDQDTVEEELCVIVRNQGDGVPFADEDDEALVGGDEGYDLDEVSDNTNKVKLSIENVGRLSFREDDSGDYSERVSSQEAEIIGGRAVVCWDMEIETDGSSSLETTIPVDIDSTYFYKQEDATTVSVEGR